MYANDRFSRFYDPEESLQSFSRDKRDRDDSHCPVHPCVVTRQCRNRIISRWWHYRKIYRQRNARSIPTFETISTNVHQLWQDFRVFMTSILIIHREKGSVRKFSQWLTNCKKYDNRGSRKCSSYTITSQCKKRIIRQYWLRLAEKVVLQFLYFFNMIGFCPCSPLDLNV